MTVDEKVDLLAGRGMWRTRNIDRLGIPSILMTDGTYGVRYSIDQIDKEAGKVDMQAFLGLVNQKARDMSAAFGRTKPATCFPNGSALGCSWDVDLAREIGVALAAECHLYGVNLLLGPGINTRRTPLAGRSYEYYSEDPIINADMAAAVINGLQDNGIGASLKHFACNNSEVERTTMDSLVDDRALREIYLKGFERAIAKSRPWTVMSSYNLLNGEQASQSHWLLTELLRDEWGYDGLVVSDWHGVKDPAQGMLAGGDLDMPEARTRVEELRSAVAADIVPVSRLDEACIRLLTLVARAKAGEAKRIGADLDWHHALAVRAARESVVLLRNERGTLPLDPGAKIAVIGRAARVPLIQGSGSATTNPFQISIPLDAIRKISSAAIYAPGYSDDTSTTVQLREEALELARSADKIVVFAHAEASEDGEGADRKTLALGPGQDALIEALAAIGKPVTVVLCTPDAVEMPWRHKVRAILCAFYAGQGMGEAVADLLFGLSNPCGKLSVTFPERLEDVPSFLTYPGENGRHLYAEGIYVGYRGYDKRRVTPAYPFGHGLSYTSFKYSGLSLNRYMIGQGESLTARIAVTNTGTVAGQEIVQLYAAPRSPRLARAPRELKGFAKIALAPGETREVEICIEFDDLRYWDPAFGEWMADDGEIEIEVGASSRDIRLNRAVRVVANETRQRFITIETQPRFILESPRARSAFTAFLRDKMSVTEPEAGRMLEYCKTSFFGIHTTLNYFFKQAIPREEVQAVVDAVNAQG
ncbi:MAG: glycosyl hydrolase [Cereibacter sphaeroides]|uniref:Beta-D-glucoside glucohydrolase n=1 Tax=Cereibacter sphaeroides TaxID=1063 RepID=A0A2W5SAX1_CERSP|nr:MAG: glycosyl hydrolase [Cereibacter sphaeroides]